MTTRIDQSGPRSTVLENPSAARVTPPPTRPFRHVLDASARAVVTGAESATRQLPGGPILAAAFRPTPDATGPAAGATPEGPTGTAGETSALGPTGVSQFAAEGDQTMYYLQLQQQISAESRAYTALSNVLKARHETVKNAIGNIR